MIKHQEAPHGVVLIVDDQAHMREVISASLRALDVKSYQAESGEQALEILANENVDVVLSDFRMPGMDGIEFLRRLREERPAIRSVLFTGHGQMETVIGALRAGASDFLAKPFENQELRSIVQRLLDLPGEMLPPSGARGTAVAPLGLLGESPVFLQSIYTARKAAAAGSSALVTGESGTGKEGVARFIHESSDRSSGPFIPVNCGAIPENLIESELFGHVRGAYTGALSDRPGKFVLAHGGTLFLDEIGEMPLPMQVRLLRALQEHAVEPVGGETPVQTDFRLIAATHRDLREDVRAGRFREDLWFRLHVIPVAMPPLRERGADVTLLARHFLKHFNSRYGTQFALSPENEWALLKHPWPGNVRELVNAVERAVVLSAPNELVFQFDDVEGIPRSEPESMDVSVRGRRRNAEREAIVEALEACRWNKTRAAERLGISRRGLLYKIKEYGIL